MTSRATPEGQRSYPITATTFVIMYKKPKDPEHSKVAVDFFKCALEQGQSQAEQLDYVPLPAPLVTQIETTARARWSVG